MDFLNENNQYKHDNVGKICFLKCGVFYIAIGIDAYLLNEILGLKLTPFGKGLCRITVVEKIMY